MAAAVAYDMIGQIHFRMATLTRRSRSFWLQKCLLLFDDQASQNEDLLRRIGIVASRLGDIAAKRGDLEKAESHYAERCDIPNSLPKRTPKNLTAQRDYCAAIDRLGNMSADRGQLQAVLEVVS